MAESLQEYAQVMAGNWRERGNGIDAFVWEEPEDPDEWCVLDLRTRDSGLLQRCNAQALERELEAYLGSGDAYIFRRRHWGPGWFETLAVRVYRAGQITDAFRVLHNCAQAVVEDQVLDSDLYYEYQLEQIEELGSPDYDLAPDDWAKRVYHLIWDQVDDWDSLSAEQVDRALCFKGWREFDEDQLLRHIELEGYELELFDCYESDRTGRTRIAYRFFDPEGELLFSGCDFFPSRLHAIDSDEAVRSLLGFLLLRPGDTDDEYFSDYTEKQLAFAEDEAEYLLLYTLDDDEACAEGPPWRELTPDWEE